MKIPHPLPDAKESKKILDSILIEFSSQLVDQIYHALDDIGINTVKLGVEEALKLVIALGLHHTYCSPSTTLNTTGKLDGGGLLRGLVGRWAKQANWAGDRQPIIEDKSKGLEEQLVKAAHKISEAHSVKVGAVVRRTPLKEERRVVRALRPPWETLPSTTIEEIKKLYPSHSGIKWVGENKIRQRALECAFAALPGTLHKATKLKEIALDLERKFVEWEKGKEVR